MKIAVLSDIHLYRRTERLQCALRAAEGADVLLLTGDIADRAQREQYELARLHLGQQLGGMPVYCVSGNHDNPARDDTEYRAFERSLCPEGARQHASGAFYAALGPLADLIGLNPQYHQKQFFFPDKGSQLHFAETMLAASGAKLHLMLCHPPLLAHNPQRTLGMTPYLTQEQDRRLQSLMDAHRGIVLLCGHTHYAPTAEWDALHHNLYLNCGSICPTTLQEGSTEVQQGNVTLLETVEAGLRVRFVGIHTGKVFLEQVFPLPQQA